MVTLSVPGAGGFTADPSVLTFSSTTWSAAQTVTVSATEDADAVAPAPATIGHGAAGGGYDAVTVEGVRVTVTENDAAGVTVTPTSLTIAEGASDAYTVLLDSQPPADVMVTLSVPGAGGFTADPSVLTFSSTTWSAAQTVTVSATEDADAVAPAPATIGHRAAGGGYDAVTVEGVRVTVTENDAAGVTVRPTSLTIAEGASDAYTVLLDSQPPADVMVTLSVPGAGGFTADPSVLTFSSTTWSTAQTVTVSATEDADAVAPAPATIGHSAAGGGYDAVTVEGVRVTVTENDAAGVTVTPTSLTIAEGASDTYTVVLTTQPTADVMVTLSVPGAGGFTADPSVLTFSSTTWSAAQTVTVSATEDADAVAPAPATIGHSAAGGGYDAVTVEGVRVTVTENDAAGVTVRPTSLTIAEGASDAYTVLLDSQPTADVMVTLSVPGAGGFTADPSVLTFSSTTWSAAQTVTVSATEDADAVAPAPATIGHSAAGGGYDAVTVEGVRVTVTENDAAGVTVRPTSLTIAEGASDTYTVVLDSQPTADVMVTLSVPGAGGFTADPSVLTFSSTTWSTAQTVTVSATEDADAVAPAPATIGHSAAGGGYDAVTVEGVRVTVTENDAAGVTVTPTSLTIAEGASDAYTVVLDDAAAGGRDGDVVRAWRRRLHGGPVGADVQLDDLVGGADGDGVGDGGRRRGGACAGDDRPQRGRRRLRRGDRRGRPGDGDGERRGRGHGEADLADDRGGRERHVHGGARFAAAGGRDGDVVRAWRRRLHGGPVGADLQLDDLVGGPDGDGVGDGGRRRGGACAGDDRPQRGRGRLRRGDRRGRARHGDGERRGRGHGDADLDDRGGRERRVHGGVDDAAAGGRDGDDGGPVGADVQLDDLVGGADGDGVGDGGRRRGGACAGDDRPQRGRRRLRRGDRRGRPGDGDGERRGRGHGEADLADDRGGRQRHVHGCCSTQPTADVMVTLSVPGAGGFTADPSVLTFSSTTWSAAQTVTVSATEDADAVAPAPATIGHSAAGGGYDAVTVEGVLVTVTDNDAAGVTAGSVALSVVPASVSEGDGSQEIEVAAVLGGGPRDSTVTVTVNLSGGTATEGVDFESGDSLEIEIPSGAIRGEGVVTVTVLDDLDVEGDETIRFVGEADEPAVRVAPALLTIEDDDAPKVPVAFGSPFYDVPKGQSESITVVLGRAIEDESSVLVVVSAISGEVRQGVDYGLPATVTFASGHTEGNFPFHAVGDAGQDVTLAFGSLSSNLTPGDPDTTQVAILGSTAGLGSTGAVSIEGPPVVGATLKAVPSNVPDPDGLGPFGYEWAADAEVVPNATGVAFVPTDAEVGKLIVVTLRYTDGLGVVKTLVSAPVGPVRRPEAGAPTGPPPTPTLTIASGTSPVVEGSVAEFHVTRSDTATELGAVEIRISETGSVLRSVSVGEVRFASGETAAVLSLETVNDDQDEPDSLVRAALEAGDGYELGEMSAATVRVTDNDAAPKFLVEPVSVAESAGMAEFVARLSARAGHPLSVAWATSDGAALAGRDYVSASGVVTFAAGETEEHFAVELIDDEMAEGLEEFSIIWRDAEMIVEQESTRAAIIDDDSPPTAVSLALDRSSVSEAAGPTAVVVTASLVGGLWERGTLVEVAVAGGGGTGGAVDFDPVPRFTLRIPPAESSGAASFVLKPEDDRVDEVDETIEITGTAALPVSPVSLILEDDDAPSRSIRLTLDRERITEDAGPTVFTVTATLDRSARAEETPVEIVLSDSGLPEAVDYSAPQAFRLTIPMGELSGSIEFTLIPENDRVDEVDETIEISGTADLAVSPASLIVEDDDGASQWILLTLDQDVILENAGPTPVTVKASFDLSARTTDTAVRIGVLGSGVLGTVRFLAVDVFELTIPAEGLSGFGTFTMAPLISVLRSSPETVEVSGVAELPVLSAGLLLVDADTGLAPAGWLKRFARTVASQTVDLIQERLDGRSGRGNQLTLGGFRLFGGQGGKLQQTAAGLPALAGHGLFGSAGPGFIVQAGPLPVGATSGGGSWLNGQGPVGSSGYGGGPSLMGGQLGGASAAGAMAVSNSLGHLASWNDRATSFSLSRYRADERRDLLARSSFSLASWAGDQEGASDGAVWTVWGRGAKSSFRGEEDELALRGDVVTGTVAVDYERGPLLTGVAIARTSGRGTIGSAGDVDVDASLTSGQPYLRIEVGEKLTLWGVLGYGEGEYRLTENELVTATDISMALAAVGARQALTSGSRGLKLSLNSDAFLTRIQADEALGLDAVSADVNRLRLAVEASYPSSFASGSTVTPSVELGIRHDGGDADTGFGVEMGAGLRYANVARGLTMEFNARSLLTHQSSAFEEWGASGSFGIDPGESGLGPALRLRSSWGAASGGVEQLWSQDRMFDSPGRSRFQSGSRLETEAGYGFGRVYGRYRLTPYGVLVTAEEGERGFGVGTRLDLGQAFSLSLEASRRQFLDAAPEDAVVLHGIVSLPRRRPLAAGNAGSNQGARSKPSQ